MKTIIEITTHCTTYITIPDGHMVCDECHTDGDRIDGCHVCKGDGYIKDPMLWGKCIFCGEETMSKAHAYWTCPDCEKREYPPVHVWPENDRRYYQSDLFDIAGIEVPHG